MEKTKFILTSKTIMGALLVIIAPLVNKYLGTNIDAALQGEVMATITALVTQFGAALAIYGRIKATKKLTI